MSDKYIIKNCPCYILKYGYCLGRGTKYCKDAIYCPIKQIAEKLKNPNNCRYSGKPLVFTDELLKLLEIQEIG